MLNADHSYPSVSKETRGFLRPGHANRAPRLTSIRFLMGEFLDGDGRATIEKNEVRGHAPRDESAVDAPSEKIVAGCAITILTQPQDFRP